MKKMALASMIAVGITFAPLTMAQDTLSEEAKLSYSLGVMLAENILIHDFADLDTEAFRQGLDAVYGKQEPLMDMDEVIATIQEFQNQQMEAQAAELQATANANFERGMEYLEENALKEGVVTTDSGLQYEKLVEGEGASPTAEDVVKVHYRGELIDGTVFDSSYDRGEPISFPLSGVISGWTEGLQLMKTGETARLVIPSDLAYGGNGMGNAIGPNETLIFQVELLEVNPE